MKDSIFKVECPCCGARLELDSEAGVLLGHERRRSARAPADLGEAVRRLKSEEAQRESRFDRTFAEQSKRDVDLDKKFDGLLRKQRGKKATPPRLRDIDLG